MSIHFKSPSHPPNAAPAAPICIWGTRKNRKGLNPSSNGDVRALWWNCAPKTHARFTQSARRYCRGEESIASPTTIPVARDAHDLSDASKPPRRKMRWQFDPQVRIRGAQFHGIALHELFWTDYIFKRRTARILLHVLLLFVQNGHWLIGRSNVLFYEAQIIKFQSLRRARTALIRILLQFGANSITDTFKIYDFTRGRVVTLVSRKVSSRVIDQKLPIPVGLPEVRQRSLEQVHQFYWLLLNFPSVKLESQEMELKRFVS